MFLNNSTSIIPHLNIRGTDRLTTTTAGAATNSNNNDVKNRASNSNAFIETIGTTAGLTEGQAVTVNTLRREGGEEIAFIDSRFEFYDQSYNTIGQLKKLMLAQWSSITMSNAYWDECKRFIHWVNITEGQGPAKKLKVDGNLELYRYVTRDNLSTYFDREIRSGKRDIQKKSVNRIIYALQKMSDEIENAGDVEPLSIVTILMTNCIDAGRERPNASSGTRSEDNSSTIRHTHQRDAHAGLRTSHIMPYTGRSNGPACTPSGFVDAIATAVIDKLSRDSAGNPSLVQEQQKERFQQQQQQIFQEGTIDAIAAGIFDKLSRESTTYPSFMQQQQRIIALEQQVQQLQEQYHQSSCQYSQQQDQVFQEGIPAQMPKTIVSVLDQWVQFGMERHEHDKRLLKDPISSQGKSRKTQNPLVHRYGKRKYIVDEIKNEARKQQCTLEIAAQRLDADRDSLNKSVAQYYKHLKSNDDSTQKRRPKNGSTISASDDTASANV